MQRKRELLLEWIDGIVQRVQQESLFVEKSGYTIETLRRVLEEELLSAQERKHA